MRPRLARLTRERQSAEELRAHTARLLHAATCGRAPLVGVRLGVSKARIQNQVAGDCANPLELIYRWIDTLEDDGVDGAALDAIARDLADRRGFDLAPRPRAFGTGGVVESTGHAAREIGEALAVALERARTPDQKLREITEAIESLHRLVGAVKREGPVGVKSA